MTSYAVREYPFQSFSIPFISLRRTWSVRLFIHADIVFFLALWLLSAARELYRLGTVRSGVPGAKFERGPDG